MRRTLWLNVGRIKHRWLLTSCQLCTSAATAQSATCIKSAIVRICARWRTVAVFCFSSHNFWVVEVNENKNVLNFHRRLLTCLSLVHSLAPIFHSYFDDAILSSFSHSPLLFVRSQDVNVRVSLERKISYSYLNWNLTTKCPSPFSYNLQRPLSLRLGWHIECELRFLFDVPSVGVRVHLSLRNEKK